MKADSSDAKKTTRLDTSDASAIRRSRRTQNAGVVDQHVDRSESLLARPQHSPPILGSRDVLLDEDGARPEFGCQRIAGFLIEVAQNDLGAVRHEGARMRHAHALGCPCNDCNLSSQSAHMIFLSLKLLLDPRNSRTRT